MKTAFGSFEAILPLLRCSRCRTALIDDESLGGLVCSGSTRHVFPAVDGIPVLGEPDVGKYDETYAARYAALWAYGFETLHCGLDEPLYRTVSSLVAEALAASSVSIVNAIIADCGCGVGRTTGDCALLVPKGVVVGIDASPHMLSFARKVLTLPAPVSVELPHLGFTQPLTILPRMTENVFLMRADVEDLPLVDACAHVALSVNTIDRLAHGPDKVFAECRRILKPGGYLVFTNPLNFQTSELWQQYGNGTALRGLLEAQGFKILSFFDHLFYREILDARWSAEEFRTLVILALKPPHPERDPSKRAS